MTAGSKQHKATAGVPDGRLFLIEKKGIVENEEDMETSVYRGSIHYVTKLADAYKVSGDEFYIQNEKSVLPLGTLTVEETKAPDGYLLDGAYMQAGDSTEQIKGMYLTQITEDGELAVLSGSNQYSVSDQVIRGGVKIQKRDLETKETKAPEGYLTDGAKAIEFSITENGKIVDLTDESHSIYNQIKRGDLEGVKIGAGTHKRLIVSRYWTVHRLL